jgi:hypothetical protein
VLATGCYIIITLLSDSSLLPITPGGGKGGEEREEEGLEERSKVRGKGVKWAGFLSDRIKFRISHED